VTDLDGVDVMTGRPRWTLHFAPPRSITAGPTTFTATLTTATGTHTAVYTTADGRPTPDRAQARSNGDGDGNHGGDGSTTTDNGSAGDGTADNGTTAGSDGGAGDGASTVRVADGWRLLPPDAVVQRGDEVGLVATNGTVRTLGRLHGRQTRCVTDGTRLACVDETGATRIWRR
jgi:hypothetical protein